MGTKTIYLSIPPATETPDSLLALLQDRETNQGEQVVGVGEVFSRDDAGVEVRATTYTYTAVVNPPAQPLEFRVCPAPAAGHDPEQSWRDFIAELALEYDLIDRTLLTLSTGPTEIAVLRKTDHPIAVNAPAAAGGETLGGTAGWGWLVPQVVGGSTLVVEGLATWFGGPHDSEDAGPTASGLVNTRQQPAFMGCALPLNGFRGSPNTLGSPLPRFKWGTKVEVTCLEGAAQGEKIIVDLIDLGPARWTGKAIDLTEHAFTQFAPRGKGILKVSYAVQDFLRQIDPRSPALHIIGNSAAKSSAAGTAVVTPPAVPTLAGLIASLGLRFVTPGLVLGPMSNTHNGVRNHPPDPALFKNILATLVIVDRLVADLDVAGLAINSSYRCPEYNHAIGGAGLSQHMAFRAIDFSIDGVSTARIAARLRQMRGMHFTFPTTLRGTDLSNPPGWNIPLNANALALLPDPATNQTTFEFHGGIGEYAKFVHVDCRGIDAEWA